jgi:hypothetical protein
MMVTRVRRGMTLIDVIVGTALMLIIFLALFGLLRANILLTSMAKTRAGATAVANAQMEYIRSLPYDSIGTVGGIPSGLIPQNATTTLNGLNYRVRTFIEYVDDPADGVGAADSNSISTDYKRVKIAVTYSVRGAGKEIDLVSTQVPPSIETVTNGGTLQIHVVNATGVNVPGATVRVVNASTTPTVDVTTFTDSSGYVSLPGAATSTQYQVYVSKTGYSSAQTYVRDTTNQNPNPGYFTVVKNQTTSGTFAIDLLATFSLRTLFPIAPSIVFDTFSTAIRLSATTNTVVSGGAVTLQNGGPVTGYALSGSVVSTTTEPAYLSTWVNASTTVSTPAGTSVLFHIRDASGALLPESALPGNAAGFSTSPINLSAVSTSTYPSLMISADLATNATTTTPSVQDWAIGYTAGPTPVPNIPFTLTGSKTTGSSGAFVPIYKTVVSTTTSSTGARSLSLEWDSYGLSLSTYDVIDACTPPSFSLSPGSSGESLLYLGPATTNALLVTVLDSAGAIVPGATVTLSRTGYTKSVVTGSCGTAYFGAQTAASDTLTITKTGYTGTNTTLTPTGHLFYVMSFH